MVNSTGVVPGIESMFKALGPLEDAMDLGQSEDPSLRELVMLDLGYPSLKWA